MTFVDLTEKKVKTLEIWFNSLPQAVEALPSMQTVVYFCFILYQPKNDSPPFEKALYQFLLTTLSVGF